MSDGLHLFDSSEYIENFVQKSAELRLLNKGPHIEIMTQTLKKGSIAYLEPGEGELIEFFYLVEGSVSIVQNNVERYLKKNDYFYGENLKSVVAIKAIETTTFLYVANEPVFHYLSSVIRDLIQLAKQVEEKDNYTNGHITRVNRYASGTGRQMGLNNEQIEHLSYAAMFHDMGKVNTPDAILNKPGKLTDEEYAIIKKHSSDGAEIVSKTYYKYLSTIVEQHHERIDGSGYPHGLKGDEIMLEAKIIAVVDTYDAMTTDRPYRKGLSKDIAIDELRKLSGSHYDGEVVEAFICHLAAEEAKEKEKAMNESENSEDNKVS